MFLRRPLFIAGILGFALAAAGCTTPSEGEPRAAATKTPTSNSTTGSSGSTEDDLPFAGAPQVNDPLDTTRFNQDPCQALTSDQTRSLNLPSTGEPIDHVALGAGCEWKNSDTRGYAQIVFADGQQHGLSSEYQANDDGKWEYFEELPEIEGYPAISRAGTDSRDVGNCNVIVGVADDMVFESIAQLSRANVGQKDPCEMAAHVAGLALQTMKEGA
jgi:hypothetical protein